ncbi:putative MATE family efflux protein [Roseimicrobium gellanilyticum]|uniref:Multidrug export protein MepA n=1 Tax=Roseimicrobium gellanilyticum TaxID=748857 RepID=A0A366HV74_9BACT|nr:MATE family efflux transporter [Roseimicrobium gellanilyticum]RBP48191.1 putative MATE family efflux protein [Roseimicrobium gellanilyticum]
MSSEKNRALTGAVLPTFFYYAIPSMVGLIALTTMSLVDGMFVGNFVGSEALASVNLLVPLLTVLYALALMFSIGGSVGAGAHIGAGDARTASSVFSQMLIATVATTTLFALASMVFEPWLFRLLNVPSELVPMVGEYFGILRWALVVQLTTMVLYYFVRADGHPILATVSLLIGSLGNIGLDLLFVWQWKWGLAGAAWSTVIAQLVQAAVLCTYFSSRRRTLHFVWRQSQWSHLFRACYNGVSEFINEISAGVIIWVLNFLLIARLGVDGVAAFSVVSYFIYLSLMLTYGIADALHLLVSQNYGAGNHQRIRQFLSTALACTGGIGLILATSLLLFRDQLTGWFLSGEDAAIVAEAGRLAYAIWPVFLVNGINVILSCYLTAIHQPTPSAIVATLRGLILPACFLLGLAHLFDQAVFRDRFSQWSFLWALPLAEWITFIVAITLCLRRRPDRFEPALPLQPVED